MMSLLYRIDNQGRKTDEKGVPYLWDPGPLRSEEMQQLGYWGLVHVDVFDLDDAEQRQAYTAVRQRILQGHAAQLCPVLKQVKPGGSWLILIEWCDAFRTPTRGSDPRFRGPAHVPVG